VTRRVIDGLLVGNNCADQRSQGRDYWETPDNCPASPSGTGHAGSAWRQGAMTAGAIK
jgi:hypothetical protein